MKKIFTAVLSFVLVVSGFFSVNLFSANAADAEEKAKTIDIYIIAGQSNAAGFSVYPTEWLQNQELKTGYSNVLYYGDAYPSGSLTDQSGVHHNYGPTKLGLGGGATKIGPELGLAKYLSHYYNTTMGREALILKYAVGSAALDGGMENGKAVGGADAGNWCPPYYSNGGENIRGTATNKDLYANLLTSVRNVSRDLYSKGYYSINYKSFYWGQGCAEVWTSSRVNRYGMYLTALINDFRKDLYKVTEEVFGFGDERTNELPFCIVEVNPTIGQAYPGEVGFDSLLSSNIANLSAQEKGVCDSMDNVEFLGTQKYKVGGGERRMQAYVLGCL